MTMCLERYLPYEKKFYFFFFVDGFVFVAQPRSPYFPMELILPAYIWTPTIYIYALGCSALALYFSRLEPCENHTRYVFYAMFPKFRSVALWN